MYNYIEFIKEKKKYTKSKDDDRDNELVNDIEVEKDEISNIKKEMDVRKKRNNNNNNKIKTNINEYLTGAELTKHKSINNINKERRMDNNINRQTQDQINDIVNLMDSPEEEKGNDKFSGGLDSEKVKLKNKSKKRNTFVDYNYNPSKSPTS